jgi:hypothetical protein
MRLIVLLALALPGCAAHGLPAAIPQAQTSTHAIIRPLPPPEEPAVIRPSLRVLPPEEFDRPFEGRLVIERSASQAEIKARCAPSVFPLHLGCARRTAEGGCFILMADDETIAKLGYTVEIVLRHEEAHCRGWPAHHPGARAP